MKKFKFNFQFKVFSFDFHVGWFSAEKFTFFQFTLFDKIEEFLCILEIKIVKLIITFYWVKK